MKLAVVFGVSLLISGMAIRLGMVLAASLGMMDLPGGHKQHKASTPFVGGFGIIAVLASLFLFFGPLRESPALLPLQGLFLGALVLFLTGLADDILHIGFKLRFIIQAMVALCMVFVGHVELASFGELVPGVRVDLGLLSIPVTVFATVGLINAVNMIDGIDGLAGSVSLVSLLLAGLVAFVSGHAPYVILVSALVAAVVGFLYYNLRYPGNKQARVFLGDNGSMVLGFVFAWLFIALSQGESPAMSPVTALWLFALPLMDTVGVMLRRIWLGKSPFRPDRHHLHHLLVRAGFRVCDIVAFSVLMQLGLGLIGVAGMLLGVSEFLMFWLFLSLFVAYCLVIMRPWRLVPHLRRLNLSLGLPSAQAQGIFVGYVRKKCFPEVLDLIAEGMNATDHDYHVGVYQSDSSATDGRNVYCVVHIPVNGDEQVIGEVRRAALAIKQRLAGQQDIEVRLFLSRTGENDLRSSRISAGQAGSRRSRERRGLQRTLIYSMERGGGTMSGEGLGFQVSVPPA